MKRIIVLIIGMLFFLFSIESISAIGIGPPRNEITFSPNLDTTLSYVVLNNEGGTIRADLYIKGDLSQYISLDKTSVVLGSGQQTDFTAHITLPASIESPGNHDMRIGALASSASSSGGTVGAKAGVESILNIFVPYQGKFLKAELEVGNVEIGQPLEFKVKLSNKGLEDIDKVSAEIRVYSGSILKGSVEVSKNGLKAESDDILEASFSTDNLAAGTYRAVAKITYDGEEKEAETTFNVGKPLVEITNVTISKFKQGEIAKMTFGAQSYWNRQINGAYITVEIMSGETVLKSIESAPKDIGSLSYESFEAFWDTEGMTLGDYNARATLHYLDKTSEKSFIISVAKGNSMILIFSISGIVIIILIFLLMHLKWGNLIRKLR
jgi:hypothetical protein